MAKDIYAFPRAYSEKDYAWLAGMTLRDWFAGQALQGMNASPELLEIVTSGDIKEGHHFDRLAKASYRQADAMLRARGEAI